MERVKEWKDGSGDTFTVIYNHEKRQVAFSSMPNYGAQRERVVTLHSSDGKDSFGIIVRQVALDTNWESKGAPMGSGVKGGAAISTLEGVDLRAVVFLDKEGNPCEVNFILVEDEERN
jgi:hypothetical protein